MPLRLVLAIVVALLLIPVGVAAQQSKSVEDEAQDDMAMARRQRIGDVFIPPRAGVKRNGKHWVAPAYRDRDLDLRRPWREGRFTRGIGSNYVWRLGGGGRERFAMGGSWFAVAPADSLYANWWHWSRDDMVLYPDPAHDGWYRAYNTRLGTYSHVRFLGNVRTTPSSPTQAARE